MAIPGQFQPKPKPKKSPREDGEQCRIRIRNTPKGKDISFSGKCSKEEIEIARDNLKE
jgi:hypothetical protein